MSLSADLEVLSSVLETRGIRLAMAESCTGGLISELITERPGCSAYFLGCAVTYSNEAKERILGVSHDTLLAHGAVCEETAREMAAGALRVFGSDVAVSVTGIAGPGGATEEKPVGLVYIAATDGERSVISANRFHGDRRRVRESAAAAAVRDLLTLLS